MNNAYNSQSFWEREELSADWDLLIVGAGIVGSSIALFYKEKNPEAEVAILERGFHPYGASTRNAGFSCIGSMSEHLADFGLAGKNTVLNRIERRWNGLQLLRATLTDEESGYEHTGGIEIFTRNDLFERCAGSIGEMNRLVYEKTGLKDVYSVTEYRGYKAITNRVEGALNSGRMMKSIHRRLSKAGVTIFWNSEVIKTSEHGVQLKDGYYIKAKNVVVAANGFTKSLADVPVKPARGLIFITKPLKKLGWKGTFNYNEGYVYFRNIGNRLLMGGARDIARDEETTHHFGVNPKIHDYLVQFTNEVVRLEAGWEIEMEWSGIMGMTPNKEPVIEKTDSGVFVAAGLSGMGVAIGMQVAKDMVQILENSTEGA